MNKSLLCAGGCSAFSMYNRPVQGRPKPLWGLKLNWFVGPSASLIVADKKKRIYILLHNTLNCNLICSWGPSGSHRGPKQPLSSLMPWAGPGPVLQRVLYQTLADCVSVCFWRKLYSINTALGFCGGLSLNTDQLKIIKITNNDFYITFILFWMWKIK